MGLATALGARTGTVGGVPGFTIAFTDKEQALIRAAADRKGVSLEMFVHSAALDAAGSRKHLRSELLADIFHKSAELNARLA